MSELKDAIRAAASEDVSTFQEIVGNRLAQHAFDTIEDKKLEISQKMFGGDNATPIELKDE